MHPHRCLWVALAFVALSTSARAQLAPPNQDYVVDIGSAPFRAPATADFTPASTFTMEGWFYLTANTPSGWLMGKGLATAADGLVSFGVLLDPTGTKVAFLASTGAAGSGRGVNAPAVFPLRTWTHVAAVMDNGAMRLLINGSVVATGTAIGAPPSEPAVSFGVGVAYKPDGSTNFPKFSGLARQVRFWNVARTAAQISAALSESLPSDRTGLVAAWPLDEGSGTTARDLSGAGRTLSTTGTVAIRSTIFASGPFFEAGAPTLVTDQIFSRLINSTLMDFDSDGDDDLIIQDTAPATFPETRRRLRAFRNNAGTFVDVTDAVLGNVTMVEPRDALVRDFNGDGISDLFLAGHGTDTTPFPGELCRLFIRTADGRLVEETATRLPQKIFFTHSIAAADIDGDGDLDIFLGNLPTVTGGRGPCFYLNDGRGFFTEATDRLPADVANTAITSVYISCHFLDVNGDGRADLLLGGDDRAPNEILLNNGTGRFVRDSRFVLPPKLFGINAVTPAIRSADFNGDGKPDLIVATSGGTLVQDGKIRNGYGTPGLQLLLNRGDGTFADATPTAGFTWSSGETCVFWPRILDFDGDGRLDILAVETLAPPNFVGARIFLNRGNGAFVDASSAYQFPRVTTLVHAGDFDRDGKTDLVTASSFSNPSLVTVVRGVKPLDRDLFQTGSIVPSRLANLSVLTNVTASDPQFTVGTVLGGAGTSGVKPLLIRAAGPALTPLGVGGALADSKLDVFSGSSVVATNDNWGGTTSLNSLFTQVGAFGYASGASLDAAVAYSPNVTAPPASFTVQVSGVGATTGAVIAELYDATPAATLSATTPRLVNVSVLKQIGSGGILTAGFVIQGVLPKQVLIRAIGPTLALAPFSIGGAISDPKLDLFLGQTAIASNDNWGGTTSLSSAFSSVGAFALGTASRDAALLVTLFPGNYTAQVSGVAGSSGLAIVEVYEVP